MNTTADTLTKFCNKCQSETERYLTTGKCKVCTRSAHAAWVAANKESNKASKKKYREANKEKIQLGAEKYREENKDLINLRNREAYKKDKDTFRERTKSYYYRNKKKATECRISWRKRNRVKVALLSARWRSNNPEKVKKAQEDYEKSHVSEIKTRSHNRRINKGKLSPGIFKKLYALQKGKCACCKQHLGKSPHIDHIIPLAKGGDNSDGNVQLLRARCNLQKSTKDPIDFMQERGFLL